MNLQNNKTKNFTPLPNEIFSLHLSTGELATYAVLMRLEDPRTYECWPSYETIGKAIGKSKSSVKRYVTGLVEKGLITVEPTSVIMRNGLKKNGNLRYHIPVPVVDTDNIQVIILFHFHILLFSFVLISDLCV